MNRLRTPRPSLALVVALLALVVALGGTSYAAVSLAKNSVLSKHIKNGQVKRADLKNDAVNSAKVKDGSLRAGDFAAGQLPAGPKGPAGLNGTVGPKGDPGAQGIPGPVNTVTVVKSDTIPAGSFRTVTVSCPAGMQALGGGPDLVDIWKMAVTSSAPLINGSLTLTVPDGQHGRATGWRAAARNEAAVANIFKVAVICAP